MVADSGFRFQDSRLGDEGMGMSTGVWCTNASRFPWPCMHSAGPANISTWVCKPEVAKMRRSRCDVATAANDAPADRLVIYRQTTGVSAEHATHCATYCTPCRPLIRAFSGWIQTPPPTWRLQD